MRTVLWMTLLLSSQYVAAVEVVKADFEHDAGRFVVNYHAFVKAKTSAVQALLADYEHLDRLSPLVERSEIIQRDAENSIRLRLVLRACVLGMCRRYIKIQQLQIRDAESIISTVIAEGSDLVSGQEHWQVRPAAQGRTEIKYTADVTPKFYIPPMVGPMFVKYLIRKELVYTAEQLERLSKKQ